MSIRLLALELYRMQQAVERLERQLDSADADARPGLEERLRKARAEKNRLRRLLDGQIDR